MGFAESIAVLLGLIALAITVTPGIANRWVAWLAWAVTGLYLVGLFASFEANIKDMAGRHRALVVLGIGCVLLVVIALGVDICRRRAKSRKASIAKKWAALDGLPVSPGVVDHGFKFFSSTDETIGLLKREVFDAVSRIRDRLLLDERLQRLSSKSARYIEKKRGVLRALAESMLDDALLLESAAKKISANTTAFCESCPAMMELPVTSPEGIQVLLYWQKSYLGSVDSFRGLAGLLRRNGQEFRMFCGKQQDLTRVMVCSATALERIADSIERLMDYFSGEMREKLEVRIGQYAKRET